MKSEFINPFLQATVKVLTTMANMTPKPGKPTIKENEMARGGHHRNHRHHRPCGGLDVRFLL